MPIVSSLDKILINGVSSDTVGLYVDTFPFPPMSEQAFSEYNTGFGGEGTTYRENSYADISITVKLFLFNGEYNPNEIYPFLSNSKTLSSSRFPDYEFHVKRVSGISPTTYNSGKRALNVTFVCSPFRYATNQEPVEISNGQMIFNHGTIYSLPIWYLHNVQSPVFLTVNGKEFSVDCSGGEFVVIDTTRMIVTSGNEIILHKTSGQLPLLASGNNEISWVGTVDKIEVKKNERWI